MKYIYKIENNINKKLYIGQTTKTLQKRWNQHLRKCRNGFNTPLYNAIRKYGEDNFSISLVEEVPDEVSLDEREQYWIDHYNSYGQPNGYNATSGGNLFSKDTNPVNLPEIREKISDKLKSSTYWKTDEWKSVQKARWTGENNPAKKIENRKKLSERVKGKNNPACRDEVKEKISKSQTGKHPTEETRKKMSLNNGRYWEGKKIPKYIIEAATKGRIAKCRGKDNHMAIGIELKSISSDETLTFETKKQAKDYLKNLGFRNLNKKVTDGNIIGDYKIIFHRKCND